MAKKEAVIEIEVVTITEFLNEMPESRVEAKAMFRHAAEGIIEKKTPQQWQAAFDRFMSSPVGSTIEW